MSTTAFRVSGIIWATPRAGLPKDAVVEVPNWLTDLDEKDYEPAPSQVGQGPVGEDEQHDVDDDDNYEPSDHALAAVEAAWDTALRDLLEDQFGVAVVSIDEFEPDE